MNSLPHILHTISFMALPLLLAMVLHEYAHGWVAHRHGDPTARRAGRLTLNPLAHIDPFGTVIFPLLCILLPGGFILGWAKPVPVNPAQLRSPRRDMALVAVAGPGMNLLLAIASGVLLSAVLFFDPNLKERQDVLGMVLQPVAAMAFYSVLINVLLMVFNLIPIPPLDGGRVLMSLLPPGPALILSRLEPYGMLVLVGLIMLDPHIHVISTILNTFVPLFAGTIISQL